LLSTVQTSQLILLPTGVALPE